MSDPSHIPTPRTDARRKLTNGLLCGAANLDLCDQIERELTAALAQVESERTLASEMLRQVCEERDALRRERDRTVTDFRNLAETLRFAEAERDEARKELAEARALIAEWRDALKQIAHDGNDAQRRADDALSIEKENA